VDKVWTDLQGTLEKEGRKKTRGSVSAGSA
jgi:hypothetical protein